MLFYINGFQNTINEYVGVERYTYVSFGEDVDFQQMQDYKKNNSKSQVYPDVNSGYK